MANTFLNVPLTSSEPLPIPLKLGTPLFIVGANGSGKSALVQHAVSTLGPTRTRRISAHRQNWMESGNINFTPLRRRQFGEQRTGHESNPIYRSREWDPAGMLQSVLFDLTATDNEQARHVRDLAYGNQVNEISRYTKSHQPIFNRVNSLLMAGGLPVSIENSSGEEILARNEAAKEKYSIAQMSDGERNAVIIAANVLTVDPDTILIIDEPERHLHRAITEPFLSALFAERPDCLFIISTHEVALPLANPKASVLILHSCQWSGEKANAWDANLLEPQDELPEEFKRAILGARKVILFVEGEPQSLDQRLYSALFPNITVQTSQNYDGVIKAVKGLQETTTNHDIKAFGLIDRDDRDDQQVANLANEGIQALVAYSVESLYYCSDAIRAVANRQAATLNMNPSEMARYAKRKAIASLEEEGKPEDMAKRLCIRKVRKQFKRQINSDTIIGDENGDITLTVKSPYQDELNRFKELLANENLEAIVARYPIRRSRAPKAIAEALHLKNAKDYQQALLALIPKDQVLADTLRKRIPSLTAEIEAYLADA